MARISLLICCLLFSIGALAQNTSVDIRQDWYGEVPTTDFSMLDTIVLRPFHGSFADNSKDIFMWHYMGGDDYRLKAYNNTNPNFRDAYIYTPEKWKLKEVSPDELFLVVRDHKAITVFHNKIAAYRIFLFRDSYHILTKIMMVRAYNFRHYQSVKTPTIMY
jgi:hypothetical protein